MIKTKRIYERPEASDGKRILVDRLWPRGLLKEEARIDLWMKDIAPSSEARHSFSHVPSHWDAFRKRYSAELDDKKELVGELMRLSGEGDITLLYSARDTQRNNAAALREYLEKALNHVHE